MKLLPRPPGNHREGGQRGNLVREVLTRGVILPERHPWSAKTRSNVILPGIFVSRQTRGTAEFQVVVCWPRFSRARWTISGFPRNAYEIAEGENYTP